MSHVPHRLISMGPRAAGKLVKHKPVERPE